MLFARFGLMAALLAFVQMAHAFNLQVSQTSCQLFLFTLSLTPAEIQTAAGLNVYSGATSIADNEISSITFSGVYSATVTSYQFYAKFYTPLTTSGPQVMTFRLLDANNDIITAFAGITETLNFQCGTTITSSTSATAAMPSSTTNSGSGSNSGSSSSNGGSNSSDASNSGTSSGSSSSTGAIAGGVVGGIVVLAALGLLAFCLMRRKKRQQQQQQRGTQQNRFGNGEADEAAFRAPNNDSTTSLATAPETVHTPMMRETGTKNIFADPTTSAISGTPSGSSTAFTTNSQAASKSSSGIGAGAGAAAAAGGIGAAAIAARKQSREQSRARSPSHASDLSPSSESSKDMPSETSPPPVPTLPATAAPSAPASKPAATGHKASAASGVAAAAAVQASSDNKNKSGKWGFKRASKDGGSSNKLPYPQAVAEPTPVPAPISPSPTTPSAPSSASPEVPPSPSRSFKVMQKQPAPGFASTAGPSSASIAPSENSSNRAPAFSPRSNHGTPAGSIRGPNYSRAPSVASMTAGFTDAPPLPSGAASVSSMPTSEFGGNMAGVGAGRSFAASSGNSTKWHQQSYNIMPNFTQRALARSTQLDEDLIFGHLGMGLTPPPGPAGNGSESGSSKSRSDPFGDR